jgi:hypothetical protein
VIITPPPATTTAPAPKVTETQFLLNTTVDFGSMTINGKKTFFGTFQAGYHTAGEAAAYMAGVLNANPANKDVFTASVEDNQLVLKSLTEQPLTINKISGDSTGGAFRSVSTGFTQGATGTTLTGIAIDSTFFKPAAA